MTERKKPVPVPIAPVSTATGRDADRTRARILAAAVRLFAQQGYARAGLRQIAREANANAALIARYFGSKEALFREALDATLLMEPALAVGAGHLGETMMRLLLLSREVSSPLDMMLLSASDPVASAISREAIEKRVLRPLAEHIGGPDAETRAALLNLLWNGFLVTWKLLPVAPMIDERLDTIGQWVATAVQAIVDGGRDGTPLN